MPQASPAPLRIVVLISGNGSNLQAIIDDISNNPVNAQIVAVVSNKAEAFGLSRARQAGIATEVITHQDYASREDFDQALRQTIDGYQADLVVLAGFMRILTDDFVNHYSGRLINIHPSLLPKYQGLNTHQRALDAGDKEHGASVHFVTPELDGGPVILQARVKIDKNDTADSLAAKVHEVEHQLYPQVVRWFAEHRLRLDGHTVLLDGISMTPGQKTWQE